MMQSQGDLQEDAPDLIVGQRSVAALGLADERAKVARSTELEMRVSNSVSTAAVRMCVCVCVCPNNQAQTYFHDNEDAFVLGVLYLLHKLYNVTVLERFENRSAAHISCWALLRVNIQPAPYSHLSQDLLTVALRHLAIV